MTTIKKTMTRVWHHSTATVRDHPDHPMNTLPSGNQPSYSAN